MSFPLLPEVAFLSANAKNSFLASVNLATTDKRNLALIKATPAFVGEMVQVHKLSCSSRAYAWCHGRYVELRWGLYALAVLLNLNVGMVRGRRLAAKNRQRRARKERRG